MKPSHPRMMAQYNRWMNERLYTHCAELPDAQRRLDRGAFFGSIHGTLNHLLLGDRIWLSRFLGRSFVVAGLDQELVADFGELWEQRRFTDGEITDWVETLTEEQLAGELRYTSVVNPEARVLPMWIAVTHFFNHQTHHRGQLTTLLSQVGIDPGVTDLMWLPEVQAAL